MILVKIPKSTSNTREDKVIELKMQTDYSLSTEVEYIGKIAYLEHSEYIVWYQFE